MTSSPVFSALSTALTTTDLDVLRRARNSVVPMRAMQSGPGALSATASSTRRTFPVVRECVHTQCMASMDKGGLLSDRGAVCARGGGLGGLPAPGPYRGGSAVVVDEQPAGRLVVRVVEAGGDCVQRRVPRGQLLRGGHVGREADDSVLLGRGVAGHEEQPVVVADDDVADAVLEEVGAVADDAVEVVDVGVGGDLEAVGDGDGVVEAHQVCPFWWSGAALAAR